MRHTTKVSISRNLDLNEGKGSRESGLERDGGSERESGKNAHGIFPAYVYREALV